MDWSVFFDDGSVHCVDRAAALQSTDTLALRVALSYLQAQLSS